MIAYYTVPTHLKYKMAALLLTRGERTPVHIVRVELKKRSSFFLFLASRKKCPRNK